MATITDDFANEADHNCGPDCSTHSTRAQQVTHRSKAPVDRRKPVDEED